MLLTFTLGATTSVVRFRLRAAAKPLDVPAVEVWPNPPVNNSFDQTDEEQSIPESLSPDDIEFFIFKHPQANLTRVWQALGIKDSDPDSVTRCGNCKAATFYYDLDDEPGDEALLKVSDRSEEAARFLVFKRTDQIDRWKLIGHTDMWGKYIQPYHMILLSGGKAWLVIRAQGASGSGVALYNDHVFRINGGRLQRIISYRAEGHQSGAPSGATREFTARVASCEVKHGQATVELDLSVAYSVYDPDGHKFIELFEKRQRATMRQRLNEDSDILDASRSNLSKDELDSVYNVDSLYETDFVKFNFAELSRIAGGKDRAPKKWLREYLKTLEHTAEVRRLEQILR